MESAGDRLEGVKRMRDELLLKIHLASKDAQDQFGALEGKWGSLEDLKAKVGPVGSAAAESAENVGAAMKLVLDELKDGYDRIRKSL